MKIYVAGPYSNLSEEEREHQKSFFQKIKIAISKTGNTAFVPFLPPDNKELFKNGSPSPSEVYIFCEDHLFNSDLLIAEVSTPSLGIGMEMGLAAVNGIPIILLYKSGSEVSDFARGMPGVRLIEYVNIKDCMRQLIKNFELETNK